MIHKHKHICHNWNVWMEWAGIDAFSNELFELFSALTTKSALSSDSLRITITMLPSPEVSVVSNTPACKYGQPVVMHTSPSLKKVEVTSPVSIENDQDADPSVQGTKSAWAPPLSPYAPPPFARGRIPRHLQFCWLDKKRTKFWDSPIEVIWKCPDSAPQLVSNRPPRSGYADSVRETHSMECVLSSYCTICNIPCWLKDHDWRVDPSHGQSVTSVPAWAFVL